MINMCGMNVDMVQSVYGRIVLSWLEEFPACSIEHPCELAKVIYCRKQNSSLGIDSTYFSVDIGCC